MFHSVKSVDKSPFVRSKQYWPTDPRKHIYGTGVLTWCNQGDKPMAPQPS